MMTKRSCISTKAKSLAQNPRGGVQRPKNLALSNGFRMCGKTWLDSRALVFVAFFILALFQHSHGAESARSPNVVIILSDDQGTLDAGCYGSADLSTPAIDHLATQGIRFTQAYAHTVCCPARAMLLTGRYPQRGGINSWTQSTPYGPKGINLSLDEVTLADSLRAAGYRTALFGKWHLGAHPEHGPTSRGFDEFFGIRGGGFDNYIHYNLHRKGRHDLFEGNTEIFRRGQYFPDLAIDRALSFIAQNQSNPFFLYLPLNLPHYPEQSLARHQKLFEKLEEPRRSYAAAISTTDDYVGRIVAQLENFDLIEDTILVFMSDNGHSEEDYKIRDDQHTSGLPLGHNFGANGGGGNTGPWIGAKGSFLEGGIRVPAILSYPQRLPKQVERDQAITAMDWFPTILELCGIQPPAGVKFDGHSIVSLVEDEKVASPYEIMHWQWKDSWMVRHGDWKLIVNANTYMQRTQLTSLHLANLADEQPELKNHCKEQPKLVARLTQLHEQWLEEVGTKDN